MSARRVTQPGGRCVVRTTLTLAEDVAIRLDRLCYERGASLKATVNDVLRAGLDAINQPPRCASSTGRRTEPLPGRLLGSIDRVWW